MPLDDLEESASLEIVNIVLKKTAAGEKVYSLAVGEPVFDTPAEIVEAAIQGMKSGMTHYTSSYGIPEVREAVVRKVKRKNGIACDVPNTIFISSKMAIFAAMLSLRTRDGQEILVPDPGYFYSEPALLAGLRPVSYNLMKDYSPDLEDISSKIRPSTVGIIINTPSNPTGKVYSESDLRKLFEVCVRRGVKIISDEAYEDLVYSGKHFSVGSLEKTPDVVISIFTLSKSYAMTGWRAGYTVASEKIIGRMLKYIEHSFTCFPPFIQHASAVALDRLDHDVDDFRRQFLERRDYALERLAEIDSFTVNPVDGAFYIFPAFRNRIASKDLCNRLLEKENVAVLPGSAFGRNGEGHVRIAYSGSLESIGDAMDRLRRFMKNPQ